MNPRSRGVKSNNWQTKLPKWHLYGNYIQLAMKSRHRKWIGLVLFQENKVQNLTPIDFFTIHPELLWTISNGCLPAFRDSLNMDSGSVVLKRLACWITTRMTVLVLNDFSLKKLTFFSFCLLSMCLLFALYKWMFDILVVMYGSITNFWISKTIIESQNSPLTHYN